MMVLGAGLWSAFLKPSHRAPPRASAGSPLGGRASGRVEGDPVVQDGNLLGLKPDKDAGIAPSCVLPAPLFGMSQERDPARRVNTKLGLTTPAMGCRHGYPS